MYAYQLFDKILSEAKSYYAQMGNKIIYNSANNLFGKLRNEGFSQDDAWRAVAGGFACVAYNDGKISYDELAAYNSISNAQKADYNTFFNVMSKYNKQQHRDYTVQLFNRMSESSAYSFLNFCIAVCIVDGNVAYNEESFCTSLCEVYLNRFYY
jgi:hypothetical protein